MALHRLWNQGQKAKTLHLQRNKNHLNSSTAYRWCTIMMSELQEMRNVFQGLETLYQTYLPKVDPALLHDLLIREQEKSERAPFYMVEVFTHQGTDSEWCKNHIWKTAGFVPAVYDKGTHYVTNMRLTLEILKALQDFDFVVEVTGDYTGTLTGRGASHEPGTSHILA